MERSVLITGGSGFLGSRVVNRLASTAGRVACLSRKTPAPAPANIRFVAGDLLDREACQTAVKGCDTIVHLAAATGKHPPAEYFRVNRDGTAMLLREARDGGVERFLFVSTVAARFENRFRYYYAESKRQAEGLVRESGLKWTIVRPTMIFGPGSPVQDGLRRLACLPVLPVFGDGRTQVQPVFVEDVAKLIAEIVQSNGLDGRTIEIGGPEVLSIEDLLLRLRRAAGVSNGRVAHLPVRAIAACLAVVEPVLRPLLPITAGQLASFVNPGDAKPEPSIAQWTRGLRGIDDMLR